MVFRWSNEITPYQNIVREPFEVQRPSSWAGVQEIWVDFPAWEAVTPSTEPGTSLYYSAAEPLRPKQDKAWLVDSNALQTPLSVLMHKLHGYESTYHGFLIGKQW